MSASIKGRIVSFGIPGSLATKAHTVTTSGILQGASVNGGGETGTVQDEGNDTVTRIDSKAENKINFEILCEPDTEMPAKGQEVTGLGTIDGIDFDAGRVFVDDPKTDYSNNAVKKMSFACTHYPMMPADTD